MLSAIDKKDIATTIKGFKSKSSTDCDDFSMSVLQSITNEICMPLTYFCNLSLSSGSFPNHMKVAKVVPLFKSGDNKSFNNYKPVSILSQFSKISEKVFCLDIRYPLFWMKKTHLICLACLHHLFLNDMSRLFDRMSQLINAIDRLLHWSVINCINRSINCINLLTIESFAGGDWQDVAMDPERWTVFEEEFVRFSMVV